MIAAFLIGAGVGLVVGAGLGLMVAALMANARVEAARADAARADARAAQHRKRAEALLAELDALSLAGPDAAGVRIDLEGVPVEVLPDRAAVSSWAAAGLASAAGLLSFRFDATPTVLLGPGQTYEQWYAAYADDLDRDCPGWWDRVPAGAAPELARLAEQRQRETYEQNELDHDRIPTREGFEERPWRPNRPGMAIYPRQSTSDGEAR